MDFGDFKPIIDAAIPVHLRTEHHGLIIFDAVDLELVALNPRACSIYGYGSTDLSRLSLSDFCAPDELPFWLEQLAASTTTPAAGVVKHRRHDGSPLYVRSRCFQTDWENRRIAIFVIEDISAPQFAIVHQAREGLAWRDLIDQSGLAVAVVRPTGQFCYEAPAFKLLFQGTTSNLPLHSLQQLLTDPNHAPLTSALLQCQQDGRSTFAIPTSGDAVHLQFKSWNPPRADWQGTILATASPHPQPAHPQASTLQVRWHELVRQLEVPFTLWQADDPHRHDFRLLLANEAAEQAAGFPFHRHLGQPLNEVLPNLALTEVLTAIRQAPASQASIDLGTLQCADRKPPQQFSVRAFLLSPTSVAVTFQNMTRSRHEESTRREQYAMESVSQLAGGVAHNFNNILTVVDLYTGLLSSKNDPTSEDGRCLAMIRKAVSRASAITRELVAFANPQSHSFERMDLTAWLKQEEEDLLSIGGEEHPIRLELAETELPILADYSMLRTVLHRLLRNACDFTEPASQIAVQTRPITVAPGQWEPEAAAYLAPGDYALLIVSDKGRGISPEILPKIFTPFYTTKEIGEGIGLGLATVYSIVKQLNGSIDVQSQPEKGTRFRIFLPMQVPHSKMALVAHQMDVLDRQSRHVILLVEDEADVRLVLRKVLTNFGYEVLQAGNGVEALSIWQQNKERISLLLTDILMPGGISGWELAEQLRSDKPELRVIYTSGYNRESLSAESRQPQGSILLEKPYSPDTLLQALQQTLPADATQVRPNR